MRLVEHVDAEPWIGSAHCKVLSGFLTAWTVSTPNPHIVQGSTVLSHWGLQPQNLSFGRTQTFSL